MLKTINSNLLVFIFPFALLGILTGQEFITIPFAHSTSNLAQPLKLDGPVSSLQFSSDGSVLWIVSGRWRMDLIFDNIGVVPTQIKNFSTTLAVVPTSGFVIEWYKLSDFKEDLISYDNKTKTLSVKGKLTITSKGQDLSNIAVDLKLINKNILVITLDPARTRDQLGETPIYGIER